MEPTALGANCVYRRVRGRNPYRVQLGQIPALLQVKWGSSLSPSPLGLKKKYEFLARQDSAGRDAGRHVGRRATTRSLPSLEMHAT